MIKLLSNQTANGTGMIHSLSELENLAKTDVHVFGEFGEGKVSLEISEDGEHWQLFKDYKQPAYENVAVFSNYMRAKLSESNGAEVSVVLS